jgi:HlyD family secretion protein
MKKSLKITLLLATAVLIVAAIWFFFLRKGEQGSLNMQTQAVAYGDILTTVTATGTIEPVKTVDVGTQVSGIIDKIYVDYSSRVKKGQLLAELDRSTLKATLVSSQASYESAKNELTYQKSNFDRNKQLYEKQSVSKTDYEEALYTYNTAKYAFTIAKSNLEKAETNLSYATITSPIDGIILSREVDEGQTVAASYSTPTMFSIAQDLTKMRVIADVDEADIGDVKIGQNVKFTVDAFPDDEFSGTVTMVRLEAQVSSNVVTYEVVIDAPNPNGKLLPGLTANVSIYTQERRNVLVIPSKAQRVQPTEEILIMVNGNSNQTLPNTKSNSTSTGSQNTSGVQSSTSSGSKTASKELEKETFGPNAPEGELNKRTIWVKKSDGTIEQRTIVIGTTDGVSTEVLSGLKKGELVVTELSISETSAATSTESDTSSSSKSPFMPTPPGQKSKK